MDLKDKAATTEYRGTSQRIIDDAPLLEWAEHRGIPPREAPAEALRGGVIPTRYLKNFWSLSFDEQIRLCESSLFVCGCGGLGGTLIALLARAGVGRLRFVDGDAFAPSNLNRQLFCDTRQIGRPKAEVARETVAAINPFVEVEAFTTVLDEQNAEELIGGADLALDALDNLQGRFILAEASRKLKIPFVHAAATGWWGQIATFPPDSPFSMQNVYGERRTRDPDEEALGVIGPTPGIIAGMEAFEAIRILTGRRPAFADGLLYFDGESGQTQTIPWG